MSSHEGDYYEEYGSSDEERVSDTSASKDTGVFPPRSSSLHPLTANDTAKSSVHNFVNQPPNPRYAFPPEQPPDDIPTSVESFQVPARAGYENPGGVQGTMLIPSDNYDAEKPHDIPLADRRRVAICDRSGEEDYDPGASKELEATNFSRQASLAALEGRELPPSIGQRYISQPQTSSSSSLGAIQVKRELHQYSSHGEPADFTWASSNSVTGGSGIEMSGEEKKTVWAKPNHPWDTGPEGSPETGTGSGSGEEATRGGKRGKVGGMLKSLKSNQRLRQMMVRRGGAQQ